MPQRVVRLGLPQPSVSETIRDAFEHLRNEMNVPRSFPDAVHAEVNTVLASIRSAQSPQEAWPTHSTDTLDIPFLTIDPDGSMDLDQALHIGRTTNGFRIHYAIADVAAFVHAGGALDAEAHKRGMTLYAPTERTPLHPPALSEDVASLLPEQTRPAAVWTIDVDDDGHMLTKHVKRGLVRSRARLSYGQAQDIVDAHTNKTNPPNLVSLSNELLDTVLHLAIVGPQRQHIEQARGGVSLNVPEQEVHVDDEHGFGLSFRTVKDIENWNAQISLLTGMAAAQLMLEAGTGLVRTLPPADPRDIKRLRRTAHALGLNWPKTQTYGEFLATLTPNNPRHAAFQHEATTLFRGADYRAFTPENTPVGDDAKHNAIGAHYAHVTAPLRRLGDRYTTEICLAASGNYDIPHWVTQELPQLPKTLATSGRRSNAYTRSTIDIVEAALLIEYIGHTFEGVIVEREDKDPRRGDIMIPEPAVHAQVRGAAQLPLGDIVTVTLSEADIDKRRIRFHYDTPTENHTTENNH
ncbi:RNB domain-containing ribonuclease [Timonella sp. A28]|uniref:RNB domain-containing ribonuclease n=1 Tax=Timonella sp. A28 TaxID=3442640 RepID=UPI003EBB4C7A